jgi:peptide/nickel transport system permease protein
MLFEVLLMFKRYPLLRYYLNKIFTYFFTIWGAFTIAFFLFRSMPTNPVDAWLASLQRNYAVNMTGGAEMVNYYKETFGLNGTLWDQYTHYLYNLIVKQNLGPSFINFPTPVQDLLIQRLPWTLALMGVSVLSSWILGLLVGGVAGWFRSSKISDWLTNISIMLSQIPPYLIAIFMVLFFAYQIKVFPTRGAYDAQFPIGFNWEFIKSVIWHTFLPAMSIIIVSLAGWILSTRSLIVSILGEDYLMYAEAKGLRPWDIMTRYALRNALLPQTMGLALTLGFMMSGQLLIEMLFVYPGIGELMMRSIQVFDFNSMMGIIILSIFSVMTASLIVELALPVIDPRIRKDIMS